MSIPWNPATGVTSNYPPPIPMLPISAEIRLTALEARLAAAEQRLAEAEAKLAALDKP